jgi:hypothetical protein
MSEFYIVAILFVLLLEEVYSVTSKCRLAAGWWFSPDTPLSSTNKTDWHDITEILLKVA